MFFLFLFFLKYHQQQFVILFKFFIEIKHFTHNNFKKLLKDFELIHRSHHTNEQFYLAIKSFSLFFIVGRDTYRYRLYIKFAEPVASVNIEK